MREREAAIEQIVIARIGEHRLRVEDAVDVIAAGLEPVGGDLCRDESVGTTAATKRERAVGDRLGAEFLVRLDPTLDCVVVAPVPVLRVAARAVER